MQPREKENMSNQTTTAARRFPLGHCVMTCGIQAQMNREPAFQFEAVLAMERHKSADWREMSAEDQAANERAIIDGSRIFSAYKSSAGRLFVITEADRSLTTLLFANEY